MKKITEIIAALEKTRFWGEVTVQFKDGHPVLMRKEERIKLEHKPGVTSRENHRDFHAPLGVGHGNSGDGSGE